MRKIVNISVSEDMFSVIQNRTRAGYHSSVSEYIRSLVRRDDQESIRFKEEESYKPPQKANDAFVPEDEFRRWLIFENSKTKEASEEAS